MKRIVTAKVQVVKEPGWVDVKNTVIGDGAAVGHHAPHCSIRLRIHVANRAIGKEHGC